MLGPTWAFSSTSLIASTVAIPGRPEMPSQCTTVGWPSALDSDALHQERGPAHVGQQYRRLLPAEPYEHLVDEPLDDRMDVRHVGDLGPDRLVALAGLIEFRLSEPLVERETQSQFAIDAVVGQVGPGEVRQPVDQVIGCGEGQELFLATQVDFVLRRSVDLA